MSALYRARGRQKTEDINQKTQMLNASQQVVIPTTSQASSEALRAVVIVLLGIPIEESVLLELYGEAYERYRDNTNRFCPLPVSICSIQYVKS